MPGARGAGFTGSVDGGARPSGQAPPSRQAQHGSLGMPLPAACGGTCGARSTSEASNAHGKLTCLRPLNARRFKSCSLPERASSIDKGSQGVRCLDVVPATESMEWRWEHRTPVGRTNALMARQRRSRPPDPRVRRARVLRKPRVRRGHGPHTSPFGAPSLRRSQQPMRICSKFSRRRKKPK